MKKCSSSSLKKCSLKSRQKSFAYAFQGIFHLLKNEPNAALHSLATVIVITTGFFFDLSRVEWGLVVLAIALVWTAEALNTALEYLADTVSSNYHEGIGRAKDCAAGGVLLSSLGAMGIGLLVFIPHIRLYFDL